MTEKLTKVEFSNLEKILYPDLKVTKAQVVEYYIKMAPKMLNLLRGRPLVLTRYPNGISEEGFYEKDAPLGTPIWVKTFKRFSEIAKREVNYVVCDSLDTLIWLANLAALEIHMALGTVDSFESPDLVLFDLDPKHPATIDQAVEIALLLKDKLDNLHLKSFVKTSGKKGLHIVVPIGKGYTFQQSREFVRKIGEQLINQTSIVITERSKSETSGKIYIDYAQNSHGKTMVCPYSLRATKNATVSTPLAWSSIKKGLNTEQLNLFTVVDIPSEPWKNMNENKQKLEVD